MKSRTGMVTLPIVLATMLASAATVTIDLATQYQTIDGFGGFGPQEVWWSNEAPVSGFYDATYLARLIDTLGLTIIRDEVPPEFEYVNDNGDPNVFNWPGYNLTEFPDKPQKLGLTITGKMPFYEAMKAKAEASGEPLKFISSIWSPPAWMKDNGSTIDGGSLYLGPAPRPDARYELAEFIAAYVKIIKQEADVDLYALSIQNELAFVEPYNSCVYTPTEFRDVLKAVGQRFVAESFTTKIFGPECMGTYTRNDGVRNYLGPINADPEAKQHLHIVAVHSYKDGVAPDYGSAPGWDSIYQAAVRLGNRPLWMTETGSGTASAWSDNGMDAAKRIYLALKHGKISAWVWWYLRDELMVDGVTPRPAFYASKHYFRYVRPGAKMVGCGADNGDLLVTAFRHDGLNSFTVVIVNQGSSSQNVSLSGSGLPAQFDIYQSTSADPRCSPKGSVASTAQLSVPGTSVTTLHSGVFVGGTGVQRPRRTPSPKLLPRHGSFDGAVRWYALSGRLLGSSPRPSAGAFYVGPARGSSGRFSLVAVPRR